MLTSQVVTEVASAGISLHADRRQAFCSAWFPCRFRRLLTSSSSSSSSSSPLYHYSKKMPIETNLHIGMQRRQQISSLQDAWWFRWSCLGEPTRWQFTSRSCCESKHLLVLYISFYLISTGLIVLKCFERSFGCQFWGGYHCGLLISLYFATATARLIPVHFVIPKAFGRPFSASEEFIAPISWFHRNSWCSLRLGPMVLLC